MDIDLAKRYLLSAAQDIYCAAEIVSRDPKLSRDLHALSKQVHEQARAIEAIDNRPRPRTLHLKFRRRTK